MRQTVQNSTKELEIGIDNLYLESFSRSTSLASSSDEKDKVSASLDSSGKSDEVASSPNPQKWEHENVTPPNGVSQFKGIKPITPLKINFFLETVFHLCQCFFDITYFFPPKGKKKNKKNWIYVFEQMLKEEQICAEKHWYNSDACHLSHRTTCVNWICMMGIDLKLERETIYRAVYYFDKFCRD
ncbi:hypothetical protein RFI_27732 [Reticulomyxa filosa]|uniref:Cyclin N-terminal domain-containing protein n=1 Tax=Reticulomyxa filosa TaxID=46433 RepID=X6M6M2_RETFI|nr:hypothetical protein RFI_27732 [Reticulomyxa filosa]|eukprot:ETO09643.1 hypothetical protein RFI_27732 [Reticulomyxa filosa]